MDEALSPTSIARQVNREGARWGLSAKIVGDQVKVCDMVPHAEARFGIGEVTKRQRPLCTVDEEHPFSAALNNRVSNGETDLARAFRDADVENKRRQQAKIDEYDEETKRIWRTRKRAMMLPGGLWVPAGLKERDETRRRRR